VDEKCKMAEFKLSPGKKQDGVYILSEINDEFESLYLEVRRKEKRVYSDTEVNNLPFISESNPHKNEWKLREKSFLRFKDYLKIKNENLNILDLGCGNGWFSGNLSKDFNHNFFCADINLTELKQGERVCNSDKIKFIYADIFTTDFPKDFFSLIILNASVQYFPDLNELFERLFRLLSIKGEIHIIDSPFYSVNEVQNAKKRTMDYYSSIYFPGMARYYHHHTYEALKPFNTKILYNPSSIKNKIEILFLIKDSPFPWILIKK
jgi:ubiquinone/menaquinone biosynthesis C-methylase UbiE